MRSSRKAVLAFTKTGRDTMGRSLCLTFVNERQQSLTAPSTPPLRLYTTFLLFINQDARRLILSENYTSADFQRSPLSRAYARPKTNIRSYSIRDLNNVTRSDHHRICLEIYAHTQSSIQHVFQLWKPGRRRKEDGHSVWKHHSTGWRSFRSIAAATAAAVERDTIQPLRFIDRSSPKQHQ